MNEEQHIEMTERTFELLERTGLNWSVTKEPLVSGVDGKATGSFGLFRSTDGEHLGTCGRIYDPMQNSTLAETITQAAMAAERTFNHPVTVNRGGSLNDGRKVYFQAELPLVEIGQGMYDNGTKNAGVQRYITATNSHDGTSPVAFGSTSVTIVCENTFHWATYSKGMARFRHTMTTGDRINAALHDMILSMEQEKIKIDNFLRMAEAKIDLKDRKIKELRNRIIQHGMGVDVTKELSTRRANQIETLDAAITKSFREQGETLWGLMNGYTRFVQHDWAPEGRELDWIMQTTGNGYKLNAAAYQKINEYVERNVPTAVLVG